ncbi:hypothetical protein [Streptomyces sp. Ag109_O5-10]|uniref:hypothetical protein n=1 Tax=Streptomyces sp. Ag109_O5-10 TaxID=1855349 RepID=UPI000B86AE26|nr:hypothetical protein [Streptomyces sp. Ag109_O5-10]
MPDPVPESDLALGLDSFGDVPQDDSGNLVSGARAIRQVVDEAVLAEETGVRCLPGRRREPGRHQRHDGAQ